jgi:hypothetical protein
MNGFAGARQTCEKSGSPMHLDRSVAARAVLTSLGLLMSVAACGAPEADAGPDFDGPPSFAGATSTGNGAVGGAGSLGSGGSGAGNPNLGNNGEGLGGNPAVSNNGGSGNTNGASGAGNPGVGGTLGAGTGGAGSDPNNAGGAGGAPPANNGGTGGGGQPPVVVDPPVPLPGGFFLIDDFEGGRDPSWTESRVGGTASTITLDTTVGANGSSSSIRIDANNVFHTMLQFALPQAVRTANEVYGRVFLRLAQTPNTNHFIWVEVGTTANDGHEMRLGHNVGRLQSNHWLNGEQDIRDRDRSLVANTWYCLEFFMSDSPDELRVWLDNEETALSTTNYTAGPNGDGNTNPVADFIPPLQAFRIGWELQNGTVWFDDVALADSQIGCD